MQYNGAEVKILTAMEGGGGGSMVWLREFV